MSTTKLLNDLNDAHRETVRLCVEHDQLQAANAKLSEALRGMLVPYAYLTDRQLTALKPNHSLGRVSYEQAQAIIAGRAAIELAGVQS